MGEMLVVRSKVKEYTKKKRMRIGSDALDALNKEIITPCPTTGHRPVELVI